MKKQGAPVTQAAEVDGKRPLELLGGGQNFFKPFSTPFQTWKSFSFVVIKFLPSTGGKPTLRSALSARQRFKI